MQQPECVAIYFLRALAVVCILLCHLFEAYGVSGSGLLYVGVPVFFAISGFLYGRRTISDWRGWGLKRLVKLYIPYLVFIVPALGCFLIFKPESMSVYKALLYLFNLQGFSGGVLGLNHLWFVTAIMVCYVFLPFVQRFKKGTSVALSVSWVVFILDFLFLGGRFHWLPLYLIAYFSAVSNLKASAAVAVAFLCLQMFYPDFDEAVRYSFVRSLSGMLVVFFMIFLFQYCKHCALPPLVKWFSDNSYVLYLVHNVLMVGPFSLNAVTSCLWLNISLMLLGSFGLAVLLEKVCRFVVGKI